ncbi:hypothetical protein [Halorubrum sp. Ea1]|nr:hypothetical protein [Halorubrum sp. Ea1]
MFDIEISVVVVAGPARTPFLRVFARVRSCLRLTPVTVELTENSPLKSI